MFSKIVKVLVVAICISLQVNPSHGLFPGVDYNNANHVATPHNAYNNFQYQYNPANPATLEQPQHHHHQSHLQHQHDHSGAGGGMMQFLQHHFGGAIQEKVNHWMKAPPARAQAVSTWIGAIGQTAAILKAQEIILKAHIHRMVIVHRTRENFYRGCGTITRHCHWVPKYKPAPAVTAEEQVAPVAPPQPEIEQICTNENIICVGNTETCVSKKDCDVALRITEKSVEGKPEHSHIEAVSALNLCHWDEQSVDDSSKVSQMLEGVGFATYDKSGNLECRKVKASDFKLVFLRKNIGTEGADDRVCIRKPANATHVVVNDNHTIMNAVRLWPSVCKMQYDGKTEHSKYELKSYLKNHVELSRFTSYFRPPFDFAENFEFQTSSQGMVITGVSRD